MALRHFEWEANALCKGFPNKWFFPVYRQGASKEQKAEQEKLAKEVCAQCPVRSECLETALLDTYDNGIWGGMTEKERDALKRRRKLEAKGVKPKPPKDPVTHCPRGHEYNKENTWFSKEGWKQCRVCKKERNYMTIAEFNKEIE